MNDQPDQDQQRDSLPQPPPHSSPPCGLRRFTADGRPIIDTLAGRASVFGFGYEPITTAIQAVAEDYLGDASALHDQLPRSEDIPGGEAWASHAAVDQTLAQHLLKLLGESANVQPDSILLSASADETIDQAIGLARCNGKSSSFRTIAFVGSDHGRTGMCRTASGRPELSSGFGPMMAGFSHVGFGDLKGVAAAIDEQTAAVLMSPIDFANAGRAVDADFLLGLRQLCDRQGILLIVDETRIMLGASGHLFSFSSIADIQADIVIASAGVFAGLPGGLIIASQLATGGVVSDTDRLPMQAAVAIATLAAMDRQSLPESAAEASQDFAVGLAETLQGCSFVRDIHRLGMTFGIELDIESSLLVKVAQAQGLRIESAGETAIRIQPPLVISAGDRRQLLQLLAETMESVERETAGLGA